MLKAKNHYSTQKTANSQTEQEAQIRRANKLEEDRINQEAVKKGKKK